LVATVPPETVTAPEVPDVVAVHDDEISGAVSCSDPVLVCELALLTCMTSVVLVMDPDAPSDPCVDTEIASEVNSVAGPYSTTPVGALAVCGLLDASAFSDTDGVAAIGFCALLNSVMFGVS
jgi:hypothetical protein